VVGTHNLLLIINKESISKYYTILIGGILIKILKGLSAIQLLNSNILSKHEVNLISALLSIVGWIGFHLEQIS
jgi:hypothetical protein